METGSVYVTPSEVGRAIYRPKEAAVRRGHESDLAGGRFHAHILADFTVSARTNLSLNLSLGAPLKIGKVRP